MATLLAYYSIATVQATSHRIFCIYCAMTRIKPMNQDPTGKKNGNNNEISSLLSIDWKENQTVENVC